MISPAHSLIFFICLLKESSAFGAPPGFGVFQLDLPAVWDVLGPDSSLSNSNPSLEASLLEPSLCSPRHSSGLSRSPLSHPLEMLLSPTECTG